MFEFLIAKGEETVNLTLPVGGDILPGGGLVGADSSIQQSFVFSKLIPFLITYGIRLAAALAVVALVIAGYQYITAYGNAEQQEKAMNTIIYSVIGLILVITAYGIITIITNIQFT